MGEPDALPPDRFNETAITKRVAEIAAHDESFASALARSLLATAAEQSDARLADRAGALIPRVPEVGVRLRREVSYPHRTIDLLVRGFRDRTMIDWLFEGADFALAVEVKTNVGREFEDRQLLRNHVALTARRSKLRQPWSGVLALAPYQLEAGDALRARHKAYIGAIRWDKAMPRLRTVLPVVPGDALKWFGILDYLERPACRAWDPEAAPDG